jgi:hypothetical protein
VALDALCLPVPVSSSLSEGWSMSSASSSVLPSACEAHSVRGRVRRPPLLPRWRPPTDLPRSILPLV